MKFQQARQDVTWRGKYTNFILFYRIYIMFVLGMNQMSFLNKRMDKKTFSENNNQSMAEIPLRNKEKNLFWV